MNSDNLTFNHLRRRKNKIVFEIQRNENLLEKMRQSKELLNSQIEELSKKIGNSCVQNNDIVKKMNDLKNQHSQITNRVSSKYSFL